MRFLQSIHAIQNVNSILEKSTTETFCPNHFQVRAELQMQHIQQKAENKFSGT